MGAIDPKTFTNQIEAPCIGGPADGMRVSLKPKAREFIRVEDRELSAQQDSEKRWRGEAGTSTYYAERMRAGSADLLIYRHENMSVEHTLFHLISAYPRDGR